MRISGISLLLISSLIGLTVSTPCDTNDILFKDKVKSVDFSKDSVCLIAGTTVTFTCARRSSVKAVINVLGRRSTANNASAAIVTEISPEHDGATGSCSHVDASNKTVHERKTAIHVSYGPIVEGNRSRKFEAEIGKSAFVRIYVRSNPSLTRADVDISRKGDRVKKSNFYIKSTSKSRQVIVMHFIKIDRDSVGNYTVKARSKRMNSSNVQVDLTIQATQTLKQNSSNIVDQIRNILPYILAGLITVMLITVGKLASDRKQPEPPNRRRSVDISLPIGRHSKDGKQVDNSTEYVDMKACSAHGAARDKTSSELRGKDSAIRDNGYYPTKTSKNLPAPPSVNPRPKSTAIPSGSLAVANPRAYDRRTVFGYPSQEDTYEIYDK